MSEALRIVRLTTTNIKRISAATIEPDPEGNLVVITGQNGQGKTSLLDSIQLALAGGRQGKTITKPIRDGETKASVEIDFGDFTVLKTWHGDSAPNLVVMAPDGATYKSPQEFLNKLLGPLSFDPLAFTRLKPKEQVDQLLAIAPLPFDPLELDAERDMIFGQRSDVNRSVRNLEGELAGLVIPDEDKIPEEPVSTSDVLGRLSEAEKISRQNDRVRASLETEIRHLAAIDRRILDIREELENAEEERKQTTAIVEQATRAVADLPEVPDVSVFHEQLENAETINATVRRRDEKRSIAQKVAHAQSVSEQLTANLETIDKRKRDALAELGEKMPVPGLSFDDTGILYNGIPFTQSSAAEQLRVSTAMAMAADPTIRIMRINDGSLLDETNLEVLRSMAEEKDYQIWIEIVNGTVGFTIEDGTVVE